MDSLVPPTPSNPSETSPAKPATGLHFERRFTREGVHPYDEVTWERRTAAIANEKGETVFEQQDCEVPAFWSQMATNVVVSKYFRGALGTPRRETSVKQMISRVVDTIAAWGREGGYFASDADAHVFQDELCHLILHQKMAFNSPVWFNIGVPGSKNQGSACFIQSVDDTMESILTLAKNEGMLFKYGSGTGTNLSPLRSAQESLAGGGTASGPVSFMKGFDAFAGVIKSGGTTRRAAKMVILNADHPDVEDFITCKVNEERKAWALIEAGYDSSFTGEAYASIFFQNSNNSVRVTDEFMRAVEEDRDWNLYAVTDRSRVLKTVRARELMRLMAESAWQCGDPGIQYDTTINDWHTSSNTNRINASNPCFPGDARVHTTAGLVPFAEMYRRAQAGEQFHVYTHRATADDPGEGVLTSVPIMLMQTGAKPLVRLQFSNGQEFRCTPNHRLWTLNRGYVSAADLVPEDSVMLNDSATPASDASWELPVKVDALAMSWSRGGTKVRQPVPDRWSCELGELTGHLIGDGCMTEDNTIWVYGGDDVADALAHRHARKLRDLFGGVSIAPMSNGTVQLRLGSGAVRELFSSLGVTTAKAHEKKVPEAIFVSPREVQGAFMRGLFGADGCISLVEGGKASRYVGLGSRSNRLLLDVQKLLSGYGIRSRIYSVHAKGVGFKYRRVTGEDVEYLARPGFDLRITGTDLEIFSREIGFSTPRKQQALEAVLGATERYATKRHVRLVSRQEQPAELVYNLTEPVHHSYIVDGFVVANCSEYMFLDDSACFAPETRISTPDGLRAVEDLYEQQERGEAVLVTTDIHSENDHRRITAHRQALVTRVGRKPVFRTKLKDGRVIRTTGDHRVLTAGGEWKRVDELVVGVDRVAIRESGNAIRFSSPPEQVSRWQMLGWLSGDGVFSRNVVALVFGPKERDTAEYMTHELNLLKVAAGGADGPVAKLSAISHQRSGVMQSYASQRTLVEHLETAYGFRQGKATTKDVPTQIHHVADDLKVAYLQGLFSADGCILTTKWATEPQVMLASSSMEMLRSVQLLLADLGITSRITWMHPAGRANPPGQLHITNQQARAFITLIGFPCSAEKEAAAWAVASRRFNGELRNPRCPKVVEVVPDGEEIVYDITEPVTHSVIAEGLIAHNCNLASINLMRFHNDDGSIDIDAYRDAIHLTITAQEILVSNCSYPTEKIGKNSEDFRPLGLGYANLGALLMARGAPYDSPQGRDVAASLTAILTGEAYAQSARIAREIGPFNGYAANRQPMLRVIGKHREAAYNIPTTNVETDLITAARHAWDEAHELGARHGYRNAQSSVIAPTGTISFLLDCDTTGVEPDIALVKYKKLVGGGMLKIVNQTVPAALRRLGYGDTAIADIIAYVDANDTIEGAPSLHDEDVAVFDCAFTPQNGKRSIAWQGHVRMMAAVQPFVSGAISKTVNMPGDSTVDDIERAYTDAWKMGIKALAIYRDGSKRSQPLATSMDKTTGQRVQIVERPLRRRLPAERQALTHRFEVSGHEGYITVGMYEDGTPGEIFLKMAKEGSTVSGLMDSFATAISLALQYGVPLQALVDKFSHTRFEPQGFTKNPEIPIAKSVMDYIFKWLASRYLSQEERDRVGIIRREEEETASDAASALAPSAAAPPRAQLGVARSSVDLPGAFVNQSDAPSCSDCGSLMVRNGACYKCHNCGATSGCS